MGWLLQNESKREFINPVIWFLGNIYVKYLFDKFDKW